MSPSGCEICQIGRERMTASKSRPGRVTRSGGLGAAGRNRTLHGGSGTTVDELRFAGRVAVVTGAGRGVGRHYAELLARRGAAVVINDFGVAPDGSGPSAAPAEQVPREDCWRGGFGVGC